MVAVFTGLGAGFQRGSGAALGGFGLLGSGLQGRGGDRVSVNAANGNLIINRRDAFLVGRGPDIGINRTYNSQGALAENGVVLDDNGDYWRQSSDRRLYDAQGGINVEGATVRRVSADGSYITYAYDVIRGYYQSTDGAGAHDRLVYTEAQNSDPASWTWTDGDSQAQETYEVVVTGDGFWRITEQTDSDGNTVTFAYDPTDGGKLLTVTSQDGSYLKYTWSGGNIAAIETYANGGTVKTHTYTYYHYDSANRLIKVVTDLTPDDHAVATTGSGAGITAVAGQSYVTTYTYTDASSKLIRSIAQTDGSYLEFTYDVQDRVTSIKQTVDGTDIRETSLLYDQTDILGRTFTRVTSPDGEYTDLFYDYKNRLIEIQSPETRSNQSRSKTVFEYDAQGNLKTVIDAKGERTSYRYDLNGNVTRVTDANGNVIYRQYDGHNNLTLESQVGEFGANLLRGGDLSLGTSIFSTFDGYTGVSNSSSPSYTQSIQSIDGSDTFVISTDGYHEPDSSDALLLASIHAVNGGDLDGGAAYSVASGEMLTFGFEAMRRDGSSSAYADMFIEFFDAAGGSLGYEIASANGATDVWTRAVGAIEVPDGAVKAKLQVNTYGRASGSTDNDPDETEFALRNFQFSRNGLSTENAVGGASQLLNTSFLYSSYDYGGGGTTTIEDVDGELALVFRDTESEDHVDFSYGSSHGIGGGDLHNGQRFSVVGGDYISISLDAKALDVPSVTDGINGAAGLYVFFQDAAGDYISVEGATPTGLADWKTATTRVVAPENAVSYEVYIRHYNRHTLGSGDPGTSHVAIRNLEILNLGQIPDIENYTAGENLLPGGDLSGGTSLFTAFAGYPPTDPNTGYSYSQAVLEEDGRDAFVVSTIGYDDLGNGSRLGSYHYFQTGDLDGGSAYSVSAGEVVSLGFDAKRVLGAPSAYASILVEFLDASGGVVSFEFVDANNAANWTRAVGKMIAPEGAVKAKISLQTYGRKIGSSDPEPGLTSFALRDFQFSREQNPAPNQLSVTSNLLNTGLLFGSHDNDTAHAATATASLDVNGNLEIVFEDNGGTADVGTSEGSYHYLGGGDLDGGESYSAQAGDVIKLSLDAIAITGAFGTASLHVIFQDASGTTLGGTSAISAGSNSWKTAENTIIAPGNTVKYKIYITHYNRYTGDGTMSAPGASKVEVRNIDVRNLGKIIDYSAPEGDANLWGMAHTRYVYDSENHLRFRISPEGRVTEYEYTAQGEVEYIKTYTEAAFTPGADMPANVDMELWVNTYGGNNVSTTENVYNTRGQLIQSRQYATNITADGYTEVVFTYDQAGQLLTQNQTDGSSQTYTYDGLGRMITSSDSQSGSTTITFNDASTQTTVTTGAGYTTLSTYNKAGDLVTVVDSGPSTQGGEQYSLYDENGRVRVSGVKDSLNSTDYKTYYHYNDAGLLVAEISHDGHVVEYMYDEVGQLIATARYANGTSAPLLSSNPSDNTLSNPDNSLTIDDIRPIADSTDIWQWNVYDGRGQVIQTIEGDGATTQYAYDFAGRLVGTKKFYGTIDAAVIAAFKSAPPRFLVTPTADALGRDVTTRNFYDNDGRLVGTLDGRGYLSHMIYDGAGRKIQDISYAAITDAGLRESGSFSELWASITPDSSKDMSRRYVYDGNDNLRYEIDANGYVTQYDYAATGILVTGVVRQTIQYASAPVLTDYSLQAVKTAVDNLAVNTADRITRMVYNDKNQLTFTIDAVGSVTEFTYDAQGQVVKTTRYAAAYDGWTEKVLSDAEVRSWLAEEDSGIKVNQVGARSTYNYYTARRELGATIDAEGYVTRHHYDHLGRKVSETRWDVKVDTVVALSGDRSLYTLSDISVNLTEISHTDFIKTRYTFDSSGRLNTVYDPADVQHHTTYHGTGQTWGHTVAFGHATDSTYTQTAYNGAGRALYEYAYADYANVPGEYTYQSYEYDGLGRVSTSYFRSLGSSESANYGQYPTTFTYDKNGNLLSTTVATGAAEESTSSFAYDGFGNVIKSTDGRGHSSYNYYDKAGRLERSVDAEGYITEYTYNSFGEVVAQTQRHTRFAGTVTIGTAPSVAAHAQDVTTIYSYDALGRVDTVTNAENYVTDTDYTQFGEVEAVTHAVGTAQEATTDFEYDDLSRLIKTIDAPADANAPSARYFESYTYDAYGNQLTVTNRLGGTKVYTYDPRGLVLSETLSVMADNEISYIQNTYTYDARGNRVSMTEALGLPEERVTTYAYDDHNRLTYTYHESVSVTSATGTTSTLTPTETIEYDILGNVARTTDASGASTYYYYDELGRVTTQINPTRMVTDPVTSVVTTFGTRVEHKYDKAGNVTETRVYGDSAIGVLGKTAPTHVDVNNYRVTQFTYDKRNQMTESRVPDIHTVTYEGTNLTATSDQDLVTAYVYDAMGRVIKTVDPTNHETLSYYDRLGNKTAQLDSEQYLTSWTYDANGNVTEETRFATQYVGTYGTAIPPTEIPTTDDRTTSYTYDLLGRRLTETRHNVDVFDTSQTDNVLTGQDATIVFTYNGLGQVTKRTEATGDFIVYEYDDGGRLTKEWRSSYADHTDTQVNAGIEYFYTGLGDLSKTVQTGSGNDLALTTDYTYDGAGRLSSMTDASGFVRHYEYDIMGRTVREFYSRHDADNTAHTEGMGYEYDAAGRVVAQGIVMRSNNDLTDTTATWSRSGAENDTLHMLYNAYGEISARSLNLTAAEIGTRANYSETFDYDKGGRMVRTTSGDGIPKFFMYDASGRQSLTLTSTGYDTALNQSATEFFYLYNSSYTNTSATLNDLTSVNVSGLALTLTQYDGRGMATKVAEPQRELGGGAALTDLTTTRSYNAFGDVVSETDARGNTLDYTYNTMGRRTEIQSPSVSVTDETGTTTTERPTEHFYYDISGRLAGQTDANGNLTTYSYLSGTGYDGSQGLVTSTSYADGGTVSTAYDIRGNARVVTDQLGRVTEQTFDAMGRVLTVTHPDIDGDLTGTTTDHLIDTYTYDGLGQRIRHATNETNSSDAITTYDQQGRVIQQIAMGGDTTTMSYTHIISNGSFAGWEQETEYFHGSVTTGRTLTIKTDIFGRQTYKNDLGGNVTTFAYDVAGRLSGTAGIDVQTYSYLNTGQLATHVNDGMTAAYGYDKAGNLTLETLQNNSNAIYLKNATATYDALGRITTWDEAGSTATPAADVVYAYDANGNIRKTVKTFRHIDANGDVSVAATTQTDWFAYDSMNRLTLDKGALSGGAITVGNGTLISYDKAGQRMTARTYFDDSISYSEEYYENNVEGTRQNTYNFTNSHTETYKYDGAGRLHEVYIKTGVGSLSGNGPYFANQVASHFSLSSPSGDGTLRGEYSYDLMGRQTQQIDYHMAAAAGNASEFRAFQLDTTYNAKGQITHQDTYTIRTGDTWSSETVNSYGSGTTYALGQLVSSTRETWLNNGDANSGTADEATSTTHTFDWHGGPLIKTITYDPDTTTTTGGTDVTTHTYDASGDLTSSYINDGRPRTVTFTHDISGQVIDRDEADNNSNAGDPRAVSYRFGGKEMGSINNDGGFNQNYADSIADRTITPNTAGTGAFRHGDTSGETVTDFDNSYEAINSYGQGSTAGSYVVRGGETLSMIAGQVYGDSSLWYKIAQINGISSPDAALTAGTTLSLPAGVTRNSYNASTFQPYNPGEAIGDVNPTTPEPPKDAKNCGVMGQILLVVVAVAATIATAGALGAASATGLNAILIGAASGAAGSVASQAVGVTTGIQDKFSWKAVGLAAIGGGVGASGIGKAVAGLSKVKGAFAQGVIGGAVNNAITQGIGVVTGLQDSFSWSGVAAAGIGGGVGAHLRDSYGIADIRSDQSAGNIAANMAVGAASSIASAATRSALDGSNFGDNIIASIPDVIGQTLGSVIGEGINTRVRVGEALERNNLYAGKGNNQVSRQVLEGLIKAGYTDDQIDLFVSGYGFGEALVDLDQARAGGLSNREATRRALDSLSAKRGAVTIQDIYGGYDVVEGVGATTAVPEILNKSVQLGVSSSQQGPSGDTIVSKFATGAIKANTAFAAFYEDHPILATTGFTAVKLPLTGGFGGAIVNKTKDIVLGDVSGQIESYVEDKTSQYITHLAESRGVSANVNINGQNVSMGPELIGIAGGITMATLFGIVVGAGAKKFANGGEKVKREIIPFDGDYATKKLLGTSRTPNGRQINYHAADRMVNPPKGRVPMSPVEVDQVLDGATRIVKRQDHPRGMTLTLENRNMPGRPRVIVDAETASRVITVINPKKRK